MMLRNSGSLNRMTRRLLAALTSAMVCGQVVPQMVLAQAVLPSAPASPHTAAQTTRGSLNLDLSSTSATLAPPTSIGGRSLNIQVGSGSQAVTGSSNLTPAQRVAVWQILSTGSQSLQLGALGNAVGGTFNLGSNFNFNITNMVIPKGVTSINNAQSLNVLGNLTNSGVLNIQSLINAPASISATNIINNLGGLITSNSALNLIASGNIANAGAILSAGSLTLTAGNTISNSGNSASVVASAPGLSFTGSTPNGLIAAAGDINLVTGNLVNSGLINSIAGNINFRTPVPSSIVANNLGGVLSAKNGAVNVREAAFTGKYDFTLNGGDVLSKSINVWSGDGAVNMDLNNVTGPININAGIAHVLTNTKDLHLGTMNLSGDPTFYNTGGNIVIDQPITTTGVDVAIVAAGDITSSTGGTGSITTKSGTGAPGGSLLMIAGAAITPAGSGSFNAPSSNTSTQNSGSGDTTTTITISGGSSTGGKIDFHNQALPIDVSGSGSGSSNSGSVSMVAFAGTGTDSGSVNLGASTIKAQGLQSGQGGNVTIVAGATSNPASGSAISMSSGGSIDTTGSTTLGGSIVMATATPSLPAAFTILNGTPSQNASINTGAVQNTGISIGGTLKSNQAPVIMVAGSNIALNGAVSSNGTVSNPGTAGDIAIYAGGNISGTTTTLNAGTTSGQTGKVLLVAGGSIPSNPVSLKFNSAGLTPPPGQASTADVTVSITAPAATLSSNSSINLPSASISGSPIGIYAGSGVTIGGSQITNNAGSSPGGLAVVAGGNVSLPAVTVSGNQGAGAVAIIAGATGAKPSFTQSFNSVTSVDSVSTSLLSLNGSLAPTATLTVTSVSAGQAPVILMSGSNLTTNGAVGNTGSAPIILSSGGNISLGGNVSSVTNASGNVDIIAHGSITGLQATFIGATGALLMVAGATLSQSFSQTLDYQTSIGTVTAANSVSGALASNASINFSGGTSLSGAPIGLYAGSNINVAGAAISSGGSSGAVTMVAGGNITAPSAAVTAGGSSGGGAVLAIAGAVGVNAAITESYNGSSDTINTSSSLSNPLTASSTISLLSISAQTAPVILMSGGGVTVNGAIATTATSLNPVLIATGGNVSLGGNITTGGSGADIGIYAGGNITGTSSVVTISAANGASAGSAGTISLFAGFKPTTSFSQTADFTAGTGTVVASAQYSVVPPAPITIGAGSINLPVAVLTGAPIFAQASGNIVLGGSGSQISTNGKGGGVTLIAGGSLTAAPGGTITTGYSAVSVGAVTLVAGNLNGIPAYNHTFNSGTSSETVTAAPAATLNLLSTSNISVGGIQTTSAPITLLAGGNVTLSGITSTGGSTNVSGTNAVRGPGGTLTIIAGGNITGSATSISTAASGANTVDGVTKIGADMLLAAGTSVVASITDTYNSAGSTSEVLAANLLVSGANQGGSITLNSLTSISSSSTTGGTFGGNITLVAYSGSAASTGQIIMPSAAITSGGILSATAVDNHNGAVTILAGGQSGTTINVKSVDTSGTGTGSSIGGGAITISTSTPTIDSGTYLYLFQSTLATSAPYATRTGNFIPGATVNGSAIIGSLTAYGGSALVNINGAAYTPATPISVNVGQNLSIGNVTNTNNALPVGGIPGVVTLRQPSSTISLIAGGTMTFTSGAVIQSNAAPAGDGSSTDTAYGVNGGSIYISASGFSMSSAVGVSANGTGGFFPYNSTLPADSSGGNGGSITIITTGSTNSSIVVGSSNFQITANADTTGGNGGSVTLTSGSNISITPSSTNLSVAAFFNPNPTSGTGGLIINPTGTGGILNLTAATTLFSSGTLDVSGAPSTLTGPNGFTPSGNGGMINITVNSTTPFNVGGAVAGAGANGIATGGKLVANGNVTTGTSAAAGNGGSISVVNKNTVAGVGGVIVQANAIQVNASDATSTALGTPAVAYPGGLGGNINLQGTTVLSLGSLKADGGARSTLAVAGSGGSITITTNSFNTFVVDPTASPTTTKNGVIGSLSASGNLGPTTGLVGSGILLTIPAANGGSISITNNGGGISLASGAGMSVAASDAAPTMGNPGGNGGKITLIANGTVFSAISLNVSGGAEAVFSATANSASAGGAFNPVTFTGVSNTAGLYLGQIVYISDGTNNEAEAIISTPTSNTVQVVQLINSYTNPTLSVYYPSGNGGKLTISSNSALPFNVNTSTVGTNGVAGTLKADGYNGGVVSVTNLGAGGGIAVAANAISAAATSPSNQPSSLVGYGGTGGTIALLAPGILGANTPVKLLGPLNVSGAANSNFGGLGGNILITSNSPFSFIIGAPTPTTTAPLQNGVVAVGGLGLSANGGNGTNGQGGGAGSISVINLGVGGITVNSGALNITPGTTNAVSGDGGSVSLQATGPGAQVLINGPLSANGGTSTGTNPYSYSQGLGGTISITSNSFVPFNVGAATTNGSTGAISANGWSGGSITITNLGVGGIIVGSGNLTVTAQAANSAINPSTSHQIGGNGGSISLQATNANVFINGTLDASGGAQLVNAGTLYQAGSGGQISIYTNSLFAFNVGSAVANNNGTTGALSATGLNGGVISITNAGIGGIIVPSGAQINVNGNANTSCTSCGSPSDLNGTGGRITLQAIGGLGNIYIGANLSADGFAAGASTTNGNGGSITIITNSATAFNVGGATAPIAGIPYNLSNGVASGITLSATGYNGGSIGIKNLGAFAAGGLTFDPSLITVSAAPGATPFTPAGGSIPIPAGNGGRIDLEAPIGTLSATGGSSVTLSADAQHNSTNAANGGIITLVANLIKPVAGTTLVVSANGDTQASGGTGIGGSIYITQTYQFNNLTVGNNSSLILSVLGSPSSPPPTQTNPTGVFTGGTISVNAPGGILVSGKLNTYDTVADKSNASGTVSLTALGTVGITTDSSGKVYTGTVNLSAGSGGIGSVTVGPSPTITYFNVRATSLNATSAGTPGCTQCNVFVYNSGSQNFAVLSAAAPLGAVNIKSDATIFVGGRIQAGAIVAGQGVTLQSTGDLGGPHIVIDNNVTGPAVKLDATSGSILNGNFNDSSGTLPDSNNWLTVSPSNISLMFVGEQVRLSGVVTDPTNVTSVIPASELETITAIDTSNNAVRLSNVQNLYSLVTPLTLTNANTGVVSATGAAGGTYGLVMSAGTGIGAANAPISTSTGLITAQLSTAGGVVNISNQGNLAFQLGATQTIGTLTILSIGTLTTLGNINKATSIVTTSSLDTILGGTLGAGTATSSVTMTVLGNLSQLSSSNVISANSITLNGGTGNFGVVTRNIVNNVYTPTGTPLYVSLVPNSGVASLAATTGGTINISASSPSNSWGLTLGAVKAGSDVLVSTTNLTGTLTVNGTITSSNGSVTLLNAAPTGSTSGIIDVKTNITGGGGPVIIQNKNTAAGAIVVEANVALSGYGWAVNGQNVNFGTVSSTQYPIGVALLTGTGAFAPTAGSNPSPSIVVRGGDVSIPVFYGNGFAATGAPGSVVLNTYTTSASGSISFQGASSTAISVTGPATISSNGVLQVLSSLDLSGTTPTSQQVIKTLQTLAGQAGSGVCCSGSLNVGFGTITFDASQPGFTPAMLSNLSMLNIPGAVTVNLANFNASTNQILVNIQGNPLAFGQNAVISGKMNFLGLSNAGTNSQAANGYPASGAIIVSSNIPGTVLTINPGAALAAGSALSIGANGAISAIGATFTATSVSGIGFQASGSDYTVPANQVNVATAPGGLTFIADTISTGPANSGGLVLFSSAGGISLIANTITTSLAYAVFGGSNYLPSAGAPSTPVQIATSTLLSAGTSLTAGQGMLIFAGSGLVQPGTYSVNLNGQGLPNYNVSTYSLFVNDSPVFISQGPSFKIQGQTLNNLVATSTGPLFSFSGGGIGLNGSLTCSSCSFTTSSFTNTTPAVPPVISASPLSVASLTTNSPLGTVTITNPAGALAINLASGAPGSVLANAGLTINAATSLSITAGSLATQSGNLNIGASGALTLSGTTLTAGTFNGVPQGVLLLPSNIAKSGSASIIGAGVTINNSTSITTVGGNLVVLSNGSPISMQGAILTAQGGYLVVAAQPSNLSISNSTFTSNAVGTMASNAFGGGIELDSGTFASFSSNVTSGLTSAQYQNPGSVPQYPLFLQPAGNVLPLGSNVNINNNSNGGGLYRTGAIVQNVFGTLNLSNSGSYPATILNVSGGAVLFNVGAGSSALFDSSSFTTNSYTAIKASRRVRGQTEIAVDECAANAEIGRVAHVFVPEHSGARVLTSNGALSSSESGSVNAVPVKRGAVNLSLKSGTMLMNPLCDTTIHAGLVDVNAKKGSIVSVTHEPTGIRVVACSGPGNVSVKVGGTTIALTPGEEILVSDRELSSDETTKADGIGRRNFHSWVVGSGFHVTTCDVSLVSLIGNLRHLQSLKNPQTALEKRIAESVLRSAAAVSLVTQGRGAYQARPDRTPGNDDSVFIPVSMVK